MSTIDIPAAAGQRAGPDASFRDQLLELIPAMRAFARSLCRNREEAEDLAQDALFRALQSWRTYQPNTNLKAWVFTILRNRFYSLRRTAGRETSLDPEFAERTLVFTDDPYARFELDVVRRGLTLLPAEQREAILLICAAGLTYEAAAEVTGVPIGTVKSRLSRGRASLANMLASGRPVEADGARPSLAFDSIITQAAALANT